MTTAPRWPARRVNIAVSSAVVAAAVIGAVVAEAEGALILFGGPLALVGITHAVVAGWLVVTHAGADGDAPQPRRGLLAWQWALGLLAPILVTVGAWIVLAWLAAAVVAPLIELFTDTDVTAPTAAQRAGGVIALAAGAVMQLAYPFVALLAVHVWRRRDAAAAS